MVAAAAAAHGVLLEVAPSGRRLARVDDLHLEPLHRLDIARRQRRDAGEPLHEVERHAFGAQQAARGAAQEEHRVAALYRGAILMVDPNLDRRLEQAEGRERERHAGEPAGAARDERRP